MKTMTKLFCTVFFIFGLAACSSGGGGGNKVTPAGDGQQVSPDSLKLESFPNVSQQIYGSWQTDTMTIQDNDSGRRVDEQVRLYVSAKQVAVRIQCSENNKSIADLAGVVVASVDGQNIHFAQKLVLQKDALCNFQIPAAAVDYAFQDQGHNDVNISYQGDTLLFHRNSDSPTQQQVPTAPSQPLPPQQGPAAPGPQQPGNAPSMNLQAYQGPQCQGASVGIELNKNCERYKGFMVQSVKMMGQCYDLGGSMDAAQICQQN